MENSFGRAYGSPRTLMLEEEDWGLDEYGSASVKLRAAVNRLTNLGFP